MIFEFCVSGKLWTFLAHPLDCSSLRFPMSGTAQSAIVNPDSRHGSNEALGQGQPAQSIQHKNYKGFVAGVFSGIAKLSGRNLHS